MGQVKQASDHIPKHKNSFNSTGEIPLLELLNSKEQLFLLDLSHRPRSDTLPLKVKPFIQKRGSLHLWVAQWNEEVTQWSVDVT